jgi:DNA-binding LytR/AlgR family response regulator
MFIVIAPADFLDLYLYFAMSIMLAYLLSYEAIQSVKQQQELVLERQHSEKLQLALNIKTKNDTSITIAIKGAGKIVIIKINDIFYCKGAGDYVEVYTHDKRTLHSGSLISFAEELPSYFLKVHRSFIVNANYIAVMRRLNGGTGEIQLSNGKLLPLSRRLLPTVKEILADT